MKINKWKNRAAVSAALFAAPALHAGTDVWFTPLTASAAVVADNAVEETAAPFLAPEGLLQVNWVSLAEVENPLLSPGQSIVRVPGLGNGASMFDMLSATPTGSHLFIPHETFAGAGVTRYDIYSRKAEVLLAGDQGGLQGNWANDWGAFDPSRWTPNDTLWLAEEWSGEGRVIEILNPMAAPADIQIRELNRIPNVAHEGINFSVKYFNTTYFIDEYNTGSIYKMVWSDRKDYTAPAQVFALKVDAYTGDPKQNWNEGTNVAATREGAATWIPLTDKLGVPLPGVTDPFRNGPSTDPRTDSTTRGGRPAADDVGATPYGRAEDMVVSRLANGNEVLYIALTSENKVISVEILNTNKGTTRGGQAMVRTFVSNSSPKNLGFPATTGTLSDPDNLAMDAAGNIYVVEDKPNGDLTGGDTWFIRDTNNDGVAESLDHFLSLRVKGSESTGMLFNPGSPTEFHICVMHPNSTDLDNVPNGLGDSVWTFNLANIPNQTFVEALNRGRYRKFTNQ